MYTNVDKQKLWIDVKLPEHIIVKKTCVFLRKEGKLQSKLLESLGATVCDDMKSCTSWIQVNIHNIA